MGYDKAIIYGIRCNDTDELYVGSTIQKLSDRMDTHKKEAKQEGAKCMSSIIISRGNYEVLIIEEYPCEERQQLRAREEYHRSLNEKAINKIRAFRTDDEKKAYKAQWHKNNYIPNPRVLLTEDEKKDKKKEYYEENKDYYQKYRDEHKERQQELSHNHYEANKETYKERAKARRETIKNDPELLTKEREYKRLKAQEYRDKKKLAQSS